jgi:hypothetical protein
MSKPKQKQRARQQPPAKPGARRKMAIALTAVVLVGLAVVLLFRDKEIDFQTLNGRWVRPDGGYLLEIKDVDDSGKIDAIYLNPNPINIAKAEASRDGSTLKVFVELRAANYPGSNYTLTYDREHDRLRGIYFQAVQQQSFNVSFVRMK